jgi:hypothetical protein
MGTSPKGISPFLLSQDELTDKFDELVGLSPLLTTCNGVPAPVTPVTSPLKVYVTRQNAWRKVSYFLKNKDDELKAVLEWRKDVVDGEVYRAVWFVDDQGAIYKRI